MIHFPDTVLHRYTYTEDGTGIYGESIQSYEYADDITVDFQEESDAEIAREYGVELHNLYSIYADITTTLNDNDQLRDDDGRTYHILGNVQRYRKFHKYLKAHLVLERSV